MANEESTRLVIGGVDTHKDLHVAALVDEQDNVVATECFATTRAGYRALLKWMQRHGIVVRVGVECTGTYGAGLLRYLNKSGVEVLEVTTPDKSDRRKRGKDDTLDAINAAHAAFARIRTVTPKTRDGMIESLRLLRVTRKTAVAARRVALQMIQMQIVCAPEELRDQLRNLTRMKLIRMLAAWRPDVTGFRDPTTANKIALKHYARRYLELHDEIADLDEMIHAIVDDLAPQLVEKVGVGYESAAQLLLTAGDNSDRIHSEASFAMLCGASPLPASSGKTTRHRLNRGGDRAANSALHMIAISRWRVDPKTKEYVTKKRAEGHSNPEILRCLKRYIAREMFYVIRQRDLEVKSLRSAA